jgi:hypothetical protein
MGSKWANGVTFVVFSHNSAIYADDVARVITSRTMTASGAHASFNAQALALPTLVDGSTA